MSHSEATKKAWSAVMYAAKADQEGATYAQTLWNVVIEFAKTLPAASGKPAAARSTSQSGGGDGGSAGAVLAPFGRQKGQPIEDLDDENLNWLLEAVTSSVNDPSKARFKDANRKLMLALQKVKASR